MLYVKSTFVYITAILSDLMQNVLFRHQLTNNNKCTGAQLLDSLDHFEFQFCVLSYSKHYKILQKLSPKHATHGVTQLSIYIAIATKSYLSNNICGVQLLTLDNFLKLS